MWPVDQWNWVRSLCTVVHKKRWCLLFVRCNVTPPPFPIPTHTHTHTTCVQFSLHASPLPVSGIPQLHTPSQLGDSVRGRRLVRNRVSPTNYPRAYPAGCRLHTQTNSLRWSISWLVAGLLLGSIIHWYRTGFLPYTFPVGKTVWNYTIKMPF